MWEGNGGDIKALRLDSLNIGIAIYDLGKLADLKTAEARFLSFSPDGRGFYHRIVNLRAVGLYLRERALQSEKKQPGLPVYLREDFLFMK